VHQRPVPNARIAFNGGQTFLSVTRDENEASKTSAFASGCWCTSALSRISPSHWVRQAFLPNSCGCIHWPQSTFPTADYRGRSRQAFLLHQRRCHVPTCVQV